MTEAKAHVVMIPYPAQGHINPALAFAECLVAYGLQITLVTTTALTNSATIHDGGSVTIHSISDGYEHVKEAETVEAYLQRMKTNLSHNLAKLIDDETMPSPRVIIYDSIFPWILDIAHERGLLGASFFTQPCGVCAVYYHLKQGLLEYPYPESLTTVSLPALPALGVGDLPWFELRAGVDLLEDQFLNLERVDWIFFNTFDKLESEVLDWMRCLWPVKTIGPTLSLLQKKDSSCNKKRHMLNLFEPKQELCRQWLDSRGDSSVVYVSFGSLVSFGKEQMEELAHGLEMSNSPYLWVVRSSEKDKLPHNLETENGLIVEWCHQPEVLAHPSVACFVTHCGWNSTLEALSHGVPLVAMGQRYDQRTNSKFVEDVWRVGVRVRGGENGVVGRKEVARCVKQVVEGDEGIEMKKNCWRWKELSDEAVGEGGTSAINVEEFVSKIMNN